MDPKTVFDAATLIAAAGGSLFVLVNLIKMGFPLTPRQSVVVAFIGGAILVILYAVSNGLLTSANAFGLATAWVAVVAAGAGMNSTANAARTNLHGQ